MNVGAPLRVATLGGPGTFAHQAAVQLLAAHSRLQNLTYRSTMNDLYDALAQGATDAIVLSEQSARRGWDEADARVAPPDSTIHVFATKVVPYGCLLLGRPGTKLSDIDAVYGHGSIGECRRWLDHHLPDVPATVHEKNSVAAAREVAAGDGTKAVVGTAVTAELTGLVPLARGIDDGATANWWVMTSTAHYVADPDEVIVAARLPGDGSLLRVAHVLAEQGFELCTAYSQPTGVQLFEHDYLLTARGAGNSASLAAALTRFDAPTRLVGAYRLPR